MGFSSFGGGKTAFFAPFFSPESGKSMSRSPSQAISMKQKFIVLRKISAQALVNDAVNARVFAFPGELFEEVFDDEEGRTRGLISIDRKSVFLTCDPWDVEALGTYGAQLLLAVTPYENRLNCLKDKNQLDEASGRLEVGVDGSCWMFWIWSGQNALLWREKLAGQNLEGPKGGKFNFGFIQSINQSINW